MDAAALDLLLDDVRSGRVSPDDAAARLRHLPFADLGFARVDHHRALRQGRAEAVYAPGKTPAQCAAIVAELLRHDNSSPVLLTRADDAQADAAMAANAGGLRTGTTLAWRPCAVRPERVVVVTAGTADLPVADECAATLAAHGVGVDRLTDVGVAGLHRLLASIDTILDAELVVVVAGMEGALASVVGGLTAAPVIAVPTSVGYGAGLEGVTALLGMLASCASGMTVVGIDNGFGAACAALRLFGPHPDAIGARAESLDDAHGVEPTHEVESAGPTEPCDLSVPGERAASKEEADRHASAAPATSRTPATGATPAVTATPATAAASATAVAPATAATPATAAAPATAVTAVAPATAVTAVAPATAVTAVAPATPATAVAPATPATAVAPATPATGVAPAAPATGVAPATPATAVAPAAPATAVAPAASATAVAPAAPAASATAVAPATAAEQVGSVRG